MTMLEEDPDEFLTWCRDHGFQPEDQRDHFGEWVAEQTGWDGRTFSLTEDERHWIRRAAEIVEWLTLYAVSSQPEPLEAALRCLYGMRPLPGSLNVE